MEESKNKSKGISIAMIILAIVLGFGFVIGLTQASGANNLNSKKQEISNYIFDEDGTLMSYGGQLTEITIPETYSLSKTVEQVEMSSSSIYNLIDKANNLGIKNYSIENQTGNYTDEYGNVFYQEKYIMKYSKRLVVQGTDYTVSKIAPSAFQNNTKITKVVIPNTVTEIGSNAFIGCTQLREITMPENLVTIGNNAFSNCRLLQNIEIPETVTFIGSAAFQNCDGLTMVNIPDGVTEIHSMVFQDCDNLAQIHIPSSVRTIYDNAFRYCRNLNKVTFDNGVEWINTYAFYGCSKLTEITLPSSLIRVNNQAFYNCSRLEKVVITTPYILDIDYNAFNNSVQRFYVPDELYDEYLHYGNWVNYSSRIYRMSEMPIE